MRIVLLMALAPFVAPAQTPSEPPALIRIIHGDDALVRDHANAYGQVRAAITVLGMSSISGSGTNWLIEAYDSFGGVEDVDLALRSVHMPAAQRWVLLYQPGLSYRPDQAVRMLPKARYYQASIYQVRLGAGAEFADLVRLRRAAYDSINLDRPEIAYQVMSGTSSGTYVFIAPLTSLKTLDNGLTRSPAYAEAVLEEGAKAGKKIAADIEMSRETLLFRTEPRLSFVPDEFAGVDSDFWTGKRVGR